jgi:tRNA A37 threonylcarbamoyladenosine modification protein TsaB
VAPLSIPWIDARGGRRYVAVYEGEKVFLAPTILDAPGIEALNQQYPHGTWLEVQPTLMDAPAILSRLLSIRQQFKEMSDIQLLNPRYLKDIQ